MLYRREGFPEEDELVLCTVTKILGHAVFVNLDEYDKGGLIHISEVAPGRIRNIREFVELTKKIVCKALRIDAERGHIDLSLRRVSEMEKKKKLEEIKQEQKAEKVIEMAAHELGRKVPDLYEVVTSKVFEKYGFVYLFFKDISTGVAKAESFISDPKVAQLLQQHVEERFKPQRVLVKGTFALKSFAPNGVEVVTTALLDARKKAGNEVTATISYVGGGRYKTKIEASNYKEAEHALTAMTDFIVDYLSAHDGEASFARDEE